MNQENQNPAQNSPELPPISPNPEPQQEQTQKQPQEPQLTKEEVEKKRKAFMKKARSIGFLVIGVIAIASLISIARFIYNQNKEAYSTQQVEESTQSSQGPAINKVEHPIPEDKWEIYASEKYKFSFEYPKGDLIKVTDVAEDEFLVQIFSSDIVPQENPDGDNLVKGYIFQVKPLSLGARDLESAVNVKRDFYMNKCPETSSVTDIIDTEVSDIEGLGFKIYGCNSDYAIDYVTENGLIYEVMQIYKGDVGFKQVYKSKANQIASLVQISPEETEQSPFVEFTSKEGFSFSYPRELNTEYGSVPTPPYERIKNIITVAENDDADAVGFFYITGTSNLAFYDLVAEQTQLLIDDFTVVKGQAPEGTQENIEVDGQSGVKLLGYSWRGNDLIYIGTPNNYGVLVLSYTGISEEILDGIIDSITFERR